MKKFYESPSIEVIVTAMEDIITTSGGEQTNPDYELPVIPMRNIDLKES